MKSNDGYFLWFCFADALTQWEIGLMPMPRWKFISSGPLSDVSIMHAIICDGFSKQLEMSCTISASFSSKRRMGLSRRENEQSYCRFEMNARKGKSEGFIQTYFDESTQSTRSWVDDVHVVNKQKARFDSPYARAKPYLHACPCHAYVWNWRNLKFWRVSWKPLVNDSLVQLTHLSEEICWLFFCYFFLSNFERIFKRKVWRGEEKQKSYQSNRNANNRRPLPPQSQFTNYHPQRVYLYYMSRAIH